MTQTCKKITAVDKLGWQQALQTAINDPAELLTYLQIEPSLIPQLLKQAHLASREFALRVPHSFAQRMQKGDLHDPLLRQVLPISAELECQAGYSYDPLGEQAVNPQAGVLHKYHGRVLLTIASSCAVNCRYCFRRHFPYQENNPGRKGWQAALDYIAGDTSIQEVILSGGDPLLNSDKWLAQLASQLAAIKHVKTLRIHTRLPIVIPQRITAEFIAWFNGSRLKPVLVIHCNHAREIDAEVAEAMQRLHTAGITLLNQSVLLKGVNDCVDVLCELSERLFFINVLPYYLHMLDAVQGAAHFAVDKEKARRIHEKVSQQLPGYLVPKLVMEQAGAKAKLTVKD